jgi:hypothetical protein
MGPIDPIRPIRLISRQPPKPADDEGAAEAPIVNVTINVGTEPPEPVRAPTQPQVSSAAHLIAQSARTRGLRAGQKVLETARSVYLETEWSGPNDRRVRTGQITKTDV